MYWFANNFVCKLSQIVLEINPYGYKNWSKVRGTYK